MFQIQFYFCLARYWFSYVVELNFSTYQANWLRWLCFCLESCVVWLLSRILAYPHWGFSWFTSVATGSYKINVTLCYATSYLILSDSLFTVGLIIWHYSPANDTSIKWIINNVGYQAVIIISIVIMLVDIASNIIVYTT